MDYLNIDKLQRVNKLAKELKGHGLANDMTDAYLSAKSMADSGNELSFLQRSFADSQATNAAGAIAGANPLQDSFLKVAQVHQPVQSPPVQSAPHVAHSGAHPVQQQAYDSGDSDKLIVLKNRLAEAEQRIVSMEDVFMKVQHVINDLINQVNDLKNRPVAAPAPQKRDAPLDPKVQEHIEAPARGAVEIKGNVRGESNGQEHPRQGKYTSEDVSIDKFFYFGNK